MLGWMRRGLPSFNKVINSVSHVHCLALEYVSGNMQTYNKVIVS